MLRKLWREIRFGVTFAVVILFVWAILNGPAWAGELEKYEPVQIGSCEDVGNLPCVKMVLKDTKIFYAIFSMDGRLLAITLEKPDGTEEVIWGKLPRLPKKKGEHDV